MQLTQTAACACLSAAFGTKEAFESVASVLAQGNNAGAASSSSSQVHVILLDLSIFGEWLWSSNCYEVVWSILA